MAVTVNVRVDILGVNCTDMTSFVVTASTAVTVVVVFAVIIVVTVMADVVFEEAKYDTEVVANVTVVDGVGMPKHWQADDMSFERNRVRNAGRPARFSIALGISSLFTAVGLL